MGASQRECSLCMYGGQVQGRMAMGSMAGSFASDQRQNWNSLSERAVPGIL